MTNPKLALDYLKRARARLKAVALLFNEEAFADVVRESQEAVELLLKAVLRSFGIAVPFR
jgi:HEPN domain-containing protein